MANNDFFSSISNFKAELEKKELEKRSRLAASGKLTARARLEKLFDAGSFTETGAFLKRAGAPDSQCDRVVTGYGAVDGRPVYAYSQDYSEDKAGFGETQALKILSLYQMAAKSNAPVVSFFDTAGAETEEDVSLIASYGQIIKSASSLKGIVPQISVICGACGGMTAVLAQIGDLIIAEKNNARIYMNSPIAVSALNKARKNFSTASDFSSFGLCALSEEGEENCILTVKTLLSYLPSASDEYAVAETTDDINRDSTVSENCTAEGIISDIADFNQFTELWKDYALEVKCGFCTIGSLPCGFIATNSQCGKLTREGCEKASNFIGLCDSFGLNLINLVDTEGFDALSESKGGIADSAASLALAFSSYSSPLITLIYGKAYGSAICTLGSKAIGADMVFALPYSQISALAPETAVSFLEGELLKRETDPIAGRAKLISKWRTDNASPFIAASAGIIDDIIEPSQIRKRIIASLYMLSEKNR